MEIYFCEIQIVPTLLIQADFLFFFFLFNSLRNVCLSKFVTTFINQPALFPCLSRHTLSFYCVLALKLVTFDFHGSTYMSRDTGMESIEVGSVVCFRVGS